MICLVEGHKWGVRDGSGAFAGQKFWVCIECGRTEPGPIQPDLTAKRELLSKINTIDALAKHG